MEKKQKTTNLYRTFGTIASYLVYPIVISAVLTVMLMVFSTPQGSVPQISGISIVKIETSSMSSAGFNVDDVVFITQKVEDRLNKQDIIAFYKFFDEADEDVFHTLIKFEDWNGEITGENLVVGQRTTKTQVQERNSMVYFHYIREVYVAPSDGTIYYLTGGSNPGAPDDGFIRADYTVGKYIQTPSIVKNIMSFAITEIGLVMFIIFPLSGLVLLEALSLIEQVNKFILDKKVFNREIPFDNLEIAKYNIGKEMDNPRKIIFYLTTPKQSKEKVFDFLYGQFNKENSSNKDKEFYEKALTAKRILEEENPRKYFDYWSNEIKSNSEKKQLKKLQSEFEYEQIIKNIK